MNNWIRRYYILLLTRVVFGFQDIDECTLYAPCGAFAVCKNGHGSYTCACPPEKPRGDPDIHCYGNQFNFEWKFGYTIFGKCL